ncbi:MAG TPA: CcmD family protein [Polyangiales bacterium]|jgi:CcmD family protein|nr:CcmD family protein [Polyangiales bacterium]
MLRRLRLGLLLACLHGFAPQLARVHAQDEKSAADERAQSFQAVTGAVKEDVAGGPLMLAAYAVVWLAVFGYVFRLVRLHRNIEVELARVERAVDSAAGKGA